MDGWIKLFRKIQSHWIWQDEKKLKWWLSILLNVNHAPQKFPVGDELLVCEAGQSFRSIEQWTSMFGCSKKTTAKFFDLLKKDGMISCKIVGNGNRRKHLLSVLNWEEYQQEETELYPPRKPECSVNGNPNVTSNKNDKNDKECKEDIIIHDWRKNFSDYLKILNEEYDKILADSEFFETQQKYYPNLDIQLSLEKSIVNFWGTEAGWKHKKKGRSKEISWRQTFVNAIPMNKVYKQNQSNGQTFKTNKQNKGSKTAEAAENLFRDIASDVRK